MSSPQPLFEKMHPRESPDADAARAVRENLSAASVPPAPSYILGAAGARDEEGESYPGLQSRYVLHAVHTEVFDGELEIEDDGGAGAGAITVKVFTMLTENAEHVSLFASTWPVSLIVST
jgi:hypothetical protein